MENTNNLHDTYAPTPAHKSMKDANDTTKVQQFADPSATKVADARSWLAEEGHTVSMIYTRPHGPGVVHFFLYL